MGLDLNTLSKAESSSKEALKLRPVVQNGALRKERDTFDG